MWRSGWSSAELSAFETQPSAWCMCVGRGDRKRHTHSVPRRVSFKYIFIFIQMNVFCSFTLWNFKGRFLVIRSCKEDYCKQCPLSSCLHLRNSYTEYLFLQSTFKIVSLWLKHLLPSFKHFFCGSACRLQLWIIVPLYYALCTQIREKGIPSPVGINFIGLWSLKQLLF